MAAAKRKSRTKGVLESDIFLPEWSSCSCNNVCNRRGEKRGACPCLAKGSFCTHLCDCGTKKMVCTNRPGQPGSVLLSELGISRIVDTDSSDEAGSMEDETLMVSFIQDEGADEHINVSRSALDRSIQFVAGDDTSQPSAENKNRPSTSKRHKNIKKHPNTDEQVRCLSHKELVDFALSAINQHPDLKSGLPSEDYPQPADSATPDWCFCGHCREMPLPEEQLCCRRRTGICILILSADAFQSSIINRTTLQIAVSNRNDLLVYNEAASNDNLRHAAYRQYVLYKHGILGKGNRVVIPSCVVWKTRDTYPSHNGTYTGFRPSRLT